MSSIYADSFGGLTAAAQNQERLRQAAFQSAMGNLITSLSQSRQSDLQNRQLDFQKKEAEDRTAERKVDVALRQKNADRDYLLNLGASTISKGRLDLERSKFDFEKTVPKPAQAREYQLLLDTADQEAGEGGITDEKDFIDKYPTLPAGLARVFVQKSQNARPVLDAQYKVAATLAQTLNQRDMVKKQMDDATALVAKHHTFWTNPPEVNNAVTQLPALTRQYQALNQTIPDKKEWQGMVYYDPDTGYKPAVTPPRWMQLPSGGGVGASKGADPDENRTMDTQTTTNPSPTPSGPSPAASSTGSASAPGMNPASEPLVKMRTRDGNVWNIPKSRLPEALSRGAEVIGHGANWPATPAADPLSPIGMVDRGYLH